MNAICLVVDGLNAGYLGCYGNTWLATPEFDHLASESFVFDHAGIDSPDLTKLYRSLWTGQHACVRAAPDASAALPRRLTAAGVATTLLTDEPLVLDSTWSEGFDHRQLREAPAPGQPADQEEYTQLVQFFAGVNRCLETAQMPFLLWAHTRGLRGAWDAPLEYRNSLVDDEDESPPPTGAGVPCQRLDDDFDPDELLAFRRAYAGQVMLLDTCIGGLQEALDEKGLRDDTLLCVVSARGFPLGEHRRLGPVDDALYGELTHVPLLFRFPDGTGAAARSQALVQPADLHATLADWFRLDADDAKWGRSLLPIVHQQENEASRDRCVAIGDSAERALRTPAWLLRVPPNATSVENAESTVELYVKPDDRWEQNDVSIRCPNVVESLKQVLDEFLLAAEANDPGMLGELEYVLREGLE